MLLTKKDREGKLEKIIDLASERLVDELQNSKKLSPALLNVIMGTAWDKRYAKEPPDMAAPVNLMINLFGQGTGERLAKTLSCAAAGTASRAQREASDVVNDKPLLRPNEQFKEEADARTGGNEEGSR